LKPGHQQRILNAFRTFADEAGFAKAATLEEIAANAGNLSIPLYVKRGLPPTATGDGVVSLREAWQRWQNDGRAFWQKMESLQETLDGLSQCDKRTTGEGATNA
jgi:type I restriction enzyme M protein